MSYVILCRACYGGDETFDDAAWLKANGTVLTFDVKVEAETLAAGSVRKSRFCH